MNDYHICIIGLGYVGLPLAHAFSTKYSVTGFDISHERIDELKNGFDRTLELSEEQVKESIENGMRLSCDPKEIESCNIYIVTVPTPIDEHKKPDLRPLISASRTVGKVLKKNDIVIYESTVYPGCTEEDCVPILEEVSGLIFNRDFFCGYSPERINPGDKQYTVSKIKKVTSGSTPEIADIVDNLYASIIEAGTHKTSSIRVAEAAKVIENSQRDINIAFVNELALIFDRMGIDTNSVLEAAGTKWNFLKFKPGLVGGHCIGVDPYYLTYKAESIGYHPEVILAGRRINDNMGVFIANKMIKLMIKKGHKIHGAKVLVLGITFKENCPDIRNSRVIDIINELREFECEVDVADCWADAEEVRREYGIDIKDLDTLELSSYSGLVVAVAHSLYADIDDRLKNLSPNAVIYDVKSLLKKYDSRL